MIAERRDGRATRARILKAAAGEFAARGYREASVRRICARANANIASVRYYFGDKLRLYKAVIDHAADQTLGQEPPPQRHQFGSAREALQAWVTWGVGFSIRRSTEQRPVSRIILREMHEPTEVFDALVRERARPVHEMLLNLVAEMLGPGLEPEGVRRVGACVLAVCSQFEHGADLFERLGFPRPRTPAQVRQATDLAVRFVVGGIDRLAADLKAGEGVVP